jgi:hypothetical protein
MISQGGLVDEWIKDRKWLAKGGGVLRDLTSAEIWYLFLSEVVCFVKMKFRSGNKRQKYTCYK